MKPAQRRKVADSNRVAAALILSDVERHGGEQALAVQWARRTVNRQPSTVNRPKG